MKYTWQSLYDKCDMHSDQLRIGLRAIPTDVAMMLTEEQMVALLKNMKKVAQDSFNEGFDSHTKTFQPKPKVENI